MLKNVRNMLKLPSFVEVGITSLQNKTTQN